MHKAAGGTPCQSDPSKLTCLPAAGKTAHASCAEPQTLPSLWASERSEKMTVGIAESEEVR